ncbi:DUF3780 domain-containing protein [Aureimonas sp. AU40]|uniref:DUF3780 domain-containing protein n=1 Tax=Aureimonas sp. AU40 TaxID=1637747 RepID=UPI00078122FA|nr:DUF3780 domain-containing protein [Aureimonas sp. AU40]
MSAIAKKPRMPETRGFGRPVDPETAGFIVDVPTWRYDLAKVHVYEELSPGVRELRFTTTKSVWSVVAAPAEAELNRRLKERKIKVSRWKPGHNHLERLLGLELLVLLFATETRLSNEIRAATLNWMSMKPEERWWLAKKGIAADGYRGWREAIGVALTEKTATALPVEGVPIERLPA